MGKRRFYFWEGYRKGFKRLDNERSGIFIKAICDYVFDGVEPDFGDDEALWFGWDLVADEIEESVRIGVENSKRGKAGGEESGRSRRNRSTASSTASSGGRSVEYSSVRSDDDASPTARVASHDDGSEPDFVDADDFSDSNG